MKPEEYIEKMRDLFDRAVKSNDLSLALELLERINSKEETKET